MKYHFKAKDIKTGEWVIGDLAYAETMWEKTKKFRPMIVHHCIHGGMLYIAERHFIDEDTLELITYGTEN